MSVLDWQQAAWGRHGTRHRCPDCEYEMIPIDTYRDACQYCGQIQSNPQRSVAMLAREYNAAKVITVTTHADR